MNLIQEKVENTKGNKSYRGQIEKFTKMISLDLIISIIALIVNEVSILLKLIKRRYVVAPSI